MNRSYILLVLIGVISPTSLYCAEPGAAEGLLPVVGDQNRITLICGDRQMSCSRPARTTSCMAGTTCGLILTVGVVATLVAITRDCQDLSVKNCGTCPQVSAVISGTDDISNAFGNIKAACGNPDIMPTATSKKCWRWERSSSLGDAIAGFQSQCHKNSSFSGASVSRNKSRNSKMAQPKFVFKQHYRR